MFLIYNLGHMPIDIDNKVTIGNIMTLIAVVVSLICSVSVYLTTIDKHTKQLEVIELRQQDIDDRIRLIEDKDREQDERYQRLQTDINRTITYLQLLLDKNGIQYVN